jgi:ATP phosphoribosyltransferase
VVGLCHRAYAAHRRPCRIVAGVTSASPLTIAVPKGRILEELTPLFAEAGIDLRPLSGSSRKLVFNIDGTNGRPYRLLLVRASDVPTYVEYGVADVGVSGSDTLAEDGADLIEPLDLQIGACRLVVAAPADRGADALKSPWIKVATKYPSLAREHFRRLGSEAIIIKLYGSVELAAIAGLADVVVDLVSTGSTLKANNLIELETIATVSSRLVVGRASLKTRHVEIDELVAHLRAAVARQQEDKST